MHFVLNRELWRVWDQHSMYVAYPWASGVDHGRARNLRVCTVCMHVSLEVKNINNFATLFYAIFWPAFNTDLYA